MPKREIDIIDEARVTLNDVDKHRWTDKRLLKLLDDGQQEICREIPLITKKVTINTVPGQEEYRLPNGAIKVLTARSGGRSIDPVSMEELDHNNPEWEEAYGNQYTALVVNNLSQHIVRPYPLMSIEYTGVNLDIKIRYSAKPILLGYSEPVEPNLPDTEEELVISDMWDIALIQYVIAKAFIDYGDESSLSRAQVASGLYLDVVVRAQKLSRKSFSKRTVTTPFQGKVARTSLGGYYGSSNSRY